MHLRRDDGAGVAVGDFQRCLAVFYEEELRVAVRTPGLAVAGPEDCSLDEPTFVLFENGVTR
jgi:hypothetical protein